MNRFSCCNNGFLLLTWFILFVLLDNNPNCLAQLFYPTAPLPFVIFDSTTVPTTAITTSTKKAPPPQAESNAQILSISNPSASQRRTWHRY
jgi:hypothetical protein